MKYAVIENQQDGRWLQVLAKGTGLILFLSFWAVWADFDQFYSKWGIAAPGLLHLDRTLYLPGNDLILSKNGLLFCGYNLLCLALVAGLYRRITAFLLLLLHNYIFIDQGNAFSYGFDYFCANALVFCVIFPAKNHQTLCLRILQIQLCMVYFFGGLAKLLGPTWHNGEALWKAVHLPGYTGHLRPDIAALGTYPILWQLSAWLVILLEMAYPIGIWVKPLRRGWLLCILCLHAGIALFMGLYFFAAIMALFNAVAFYLPYRQRHPSLLQITYHSILSPLNPAVRKRKTRKGQRRLIQTPPDDMT